MVSDPTWCNGLTQWGHVLILVLIEDGLWPTVCEAGALTPLRLNPCFNGRWSLTRQTLTNFRLLRCLNPCFNGRWSLTSLHLVDPLLPRWVLILVLMEDGLWRLAKQASLNVLGRLNPCFNGRWSLTCAWDSPRIWRLAVLILVLMEDGLWLQVVSLRKTLQKLVLILVLMEDGLWQRIRDQWPSVWSLNPCFNGRWSLTIVNKSWIPTLCRVLILVLMEDGLWRRESTSNDVHYWS